MRYAIVIEKAEGNYSAYVPELPSASLNSTIGSNNTVELMVRQFQRQT
jgi:hypothetical protein